MTPGRRRRLLLLLALLATAAWGASWARYYVRHAGGDGALAEANRQATAQRRDALLAGGVYAEEGFQRLTAPQPGEWLYQRPEGGQTFEEFCRRRPLRKSAERGVIVLQPFEPLSPRARGVLEAVRAYTEAFFAVPARLADPLPLPPEAFVAGRSQYHADRLLDLLAARKPADALVYAGVADQDLYADGLNFVFGLGRLDVGLGVYSFQRFWRPGLEEPRYLRRCIQLLNHEVGHSFGIYHCIYFRCTMNGSNSLPETDGAPPHLCPVCLRKLQHSLGFALTGRYRALASWYGAHGLPAEETWVRARLEQLAASRDDVLWRATPGG